MSIYSLLLEGILISLVVSLIIFFMGFFFQRYILTPYRRRYNTLMTLMPFNVSAGEIVLNYGLIPPGDTGRNYLAEEGDLAAIYTILDTLSFLFTRKKIKVKNHINTLENLTDITNLVAIGGPKWNLITETFIGKLGSPAYFSKSKGNIIIRNKNGVDEEFATIRTLPQLANKCYGLILSGTCRFSDGSNKNILICGGNTTLSTLGISIYLNKLSKNRNYPKILKDNNIIGKKKWGILLEINNNMPLDNEGLIWSTINPGVIDIIVKKYIKEEDFLDSYIYEYNST